MAQRVNYWSCSAFADWLRGTAKPGAQTSKGWNEWRKTAQSAHKFRYWLAEEGLDAIQNFIHWPVDKLYDVKYYCVNRWQSKTHALTSNMKKGQWHEFDDRVLHCLFDELVNFVEIEQAWCYIAWDKEARAKYKVPFWGRGWFRTRTWRSPEAGLEYLEWARNLRTDEGWGVEKDSPQYGELTHQALNAQEVYELYNWWKNIRPLRPDPHEASGWTAICEARRSDDDFLWEDQNDEQRKETRSALDRCTQLETQYLEEDDAMLVRLIKARHGMWT